MLRRMASAPALRAALGASTPAVRAAPARGMVSTVLLSRGSYDSAKSAELKSELKQRGLATSGRRAELIQRLLDNDGRRAAGHGNVPPPLPSSTPAPSSSRSVSSSTTAKARPVARATATNASSGAPPPPTEGAVGVAAPGGGAAGASISQPPNMEPGTVSNTKDAVSDLDLAAPDTNPPGLPPQKNPSPPITFDVKIPYYPEPPLAGPEIPLFTSYLDPSHRAAIDENAPRPYIPRVMAVAGETVSHAAAEVNDVVVEEGDATADGQGKKKEAAPRGVVGDLFAQLKRDLGIEEETAKKVEQKAEEGASSLAAGADAARSALDSAKKGLAEAVKSDDKSGSSSSGSSGSSSSSSSGAAEASGLYVFLGVVGAGWLAGSLGKPSKKAQHKVEDELRKIRAEGAVARAIIDAKDGRQWSDADVADLVARAEAALKK